MAVATAAKQVMYDGMDCVVGGGLDSISLVQNEHMNGHRLVDNELVGMHKDIYMPMLQTAEVVAARYGISRDAMDEYGFESQERTAAAYAAGRYDASWCRLPVSALSTTKRRVSSPRGGYRHS